MKTIQSIMDDCEVFERIGGDRGRLAKQLRIAILALQSLSKRDHRESTAAKTLDAIQEA